MPTITTYSVGSDGGRDFSTLQAAAASFGSKSLVADDEQIILEVHNDSIFLISGNIDFSSLTTDATRNLIIRPASGDSLWDNLGTDGIRYYGTSKGVTFSQSWGAALSFILPSYTKVQNLQLYNYGSSRGGWFVNSSGGATVEVTGCLFFSDITDGYVGWFYHTMKNCYIISTGALTNGAGVLRCRNGAVVDSTVVVRPSDAVANIGSTGIIQNYGNATIRNCAVFGFGAAVHINGNVEVNNASEEATGTTGLINLTFTDQFVNTTLSAMDLRIKVSGSLFEAASTGAISPDVFGTVRDGSNPDIGPYEHVELVVNNAPTGSVVVTGTTVQGQTLTSTNTLADADGLGTFTYAWLRDDVVISGATSDTYVLTAFDVNTTIKSRISYTDGEGNAESEESAGVGPIASKVETTYQDCYFTFVSDHTKVHGVSTFTNIPLPFKLVDVPAAFYDGGASSAANGGGNIEFHKEHPFTGSSRIPCKITSFDINAGTISGEFLHPSFSAINNETIYVRKVNSDQVQPAADEAYGSDLVDNAVTFPDNADLTSTLATAASDDAFFSTGAMVCELVGGVTPSEPSEYRFLQSVLSDPISSVMRTYDG